MIAIDENRRKKGNSEYKIYEKSFLDV